MKFRRPRRQLSSSGGILLPTNRRIVVRNAPHRNTVLYGAHGRAEIAPYARLVDDLDDDVAFAVARFAPLVAPNGLMRAVLARRPAQLAVDALVLIELREQMKVEIEI